MFSIVLFDKKLKKVFFIRDHFGQKPLYFFKSKTNLLVSSEIKDILYILKKNKHKLKEDNDIVEKYLLRGWADDSSKTFFKEINQFPAGSYSTFYQNKISNPKFYWKLGTQGEKNYNPKNFIREFKNNVKLHLKSDVPIAFTLSGGLDSGSVVCLAKKFKKKLHAFSLKSGYDDESNIINSFLKNSEIKHSYVNINKISNANALKELIQIQDEPLISPSHFDQYLLRKFIKKKGYKVVVTGEGGDEILGGYYRQIIPYLYQMYVKKRININKVIKKNLIVFYGKKNNLLQKLSEFSNKKKIGNDIEDFSAFNYLINKKFKLKTELNYKNKVFTHTKNLFKNNLKQHLFYRDLPYILRSEDRISMSQSIENRSPFLDYKLAEFVFGHKTQYFVKDGIPKYMLRRAMKDLLPLEYIQFRKQGRSQNPSNILRLNSKIFIKLLKKHKIKNFNKKKILRDHLNFLDSFGKFKNENFFFRVLNYLIWKDNNFRNN